MASINILPPEILDRITSMITTCDQTHLWQCGSRILNVKLKNGGLKITSLQWDFSCWMPWPRWFFETFQGLEEVEWSIWTMASYCPTLELKLLPNTLKRLTLDCEDIFYILMRDSVNFRELLPMLTFLSLSGLNLGEKVLKNLPDSLIELSIAAHGEKITSDCIFRDLPRNIEHLACWFKVRDLAEHGNDLPGGLKVLLISSLEASFDWFAKLPQTLKSLSIEAKGLMWHSLPPQLEKLSTSYPFLIPTSQLPKLPTNLKSLTGWFDPDLTDNDVSLLPKSLTHLTNWRSELTHLGVQQLPGVTDLESYVTVSHPEIFSFFNPESIRMHLKMGPFSEQLKLIPLPSKLQSLEIDYINDDICALLPSGLTYLEVQKGLITAKGASKLPTDLYCLRSNLGVFEKNETIAYLSFIPRIFFLSAPAHDMDEKWLDFLRPSYLLPNTTSALVTLDFDYLRSGVNADDKQHQLTDLSIDFAEELGMSMSLAILFRSLPRFTQLTILCIKCSNKDLRGEWLQYVPENVTELDLGLFDTYPTPEEVATLPKCLKSLTLEIKSVPSHLPSGTLKANWKDEDLKALPRSLQRFVINGKFPDLTPGMNEFVPPYLQEMRVNLYDFDLFETPLTRFSQERERSNLSQDEEEGEA